MEEFIKNWLFDPTVAKIVAVIVSLLVLSVVIRFAQRIISRRVKDSDTRYRVRKFVTFAGYLLGIVVIATVFSDRLRGLTVAFGVAGAGIAFALQEVIASVAGWLAVTFGNFYKTGDRVQLGGIKGDVIDISILRTTVMELGQWVNADQYNGRMVRIANSFVFKEPVFNYSGDFPFLWDEITVPVKYGSTVKQAREILQRVAKEVVGDYEPQASAAWQELVSKFMIENAVVEPMVTLTANDNWIEFTLRYAVAYDKRRTTKDRLFTRILEEIEKTNGAVSLASATFHLVQAPEIKVKLTGSP